MADSVHRIGCRPRWVVDYLLILPSPEVPENIPVSENGRDPQRGTSAGYSKVADSEDEDDGDPSVSAEP